MLIGAIVLGLVAVLVMRFYIGTGSTATATAVAVAPRPTFVVVAAVPVASGAPLDAKQFKLAAWPAESVPAGSFHTLAQIGTGRMLAMPLAAGEPLLPGKIAGVGPTAGIATRIAPDMRAATIRVTDVTGTGGYIFPGQRVDVFVTRAATQTELPSTDVLAQDVRVIGVNQDANEAKDKPEVVQSVTVEVTPVQGLKLALAQTVGTVSLVLRNPANRAPSQLPTIRVADLRDRGGAAPAPPSAPHRVRARRAVHHAPRLPAGTTIEVVRGTDRAVYRIARGE